MILCHSLSSYHDVVLHALYAYLVGCVGCMDVVPDKMRCVFVDFTDAMTSSSSSLSTESTYSPCPGHYKVNEVIEVIAIVEWPVSCTPSHSGGIYADDAIVACLPTLMVLHARSLSNLSNLCRIQL